MDVFCCNVLCVLSELRVQLSRVLNSPEFPGWEFRCWCPKARVGSSYLFRQGFPSPRQCRTLTALSGGVTIQEFSPSKSTTDRKRCEIAALGIRGILLRNYNNMGILLFSGLSEVRVGPWPGHLVTIPHTQLTEQLAAVTAPAGSVNAPASLWKKKKKRGRAYNAWTEYLVPGNAAEEQF